MKFRYLHYALLLMIAYGSSGCSVREIYLIRNLSDQPVLIHIMAATGAAQDLRPDSPRLPERSDVRMVRHIIGLREAIDAAGSFPEVLDPCRIAPGHYEYTLPAGASLDMSLLLRQLFKHPTSAAILEIRQPQGVISIPSLAVLRTRFAEKFFFAGPLIRYLDLQP